MTFEVGQEVYFCYKDTTTPWASNRRCTILRYKAEGRGNNGGGHPDRGRYYEVFYHGTMTRAWPVSRHLRPIFSGPDRIEEMFS